MTFRRLGVLAGVFAVLAMASGCGGKSAATSDAGSVTAADGGGDGSGLKADGSGGDGGDGGDAASGGDGDGGGSKPSLLGVRSLRFAEDLTAAWGSDSDDVWLVGSAGRVLHWNGQTLSPRNANTAKDLFGVWGRSAKEVYVVGDGLILRWDGASWQDETPAGVGILRAVHVPADGSTVLAAGDGGVVLRRGDDGKWTAEGTDSKLNIKSLWAANASQAWAVGEQGRRLRLEGGAWAESDMPGANSRTVRRVASSQDGRLFACGDGGYLAATDEGGTWQQMLANDGDTPRDLTGLWVRGSSDVWAVGSSGALLHLEGKKWQLASIAGTYMKLASFLGLFGSTDSGGEPYAFAVGVDGAGLQFVPGDASNNDPALQGDRWLDFRAETAADLLSVQADTDGSLIACGTSGVALWAKDSQSSFYDLAAPVTAADFSDCTLRGGEAWLVGVGNGVLPGGGAQPWQTDAVPGTKHLRGIARIGGDLFAVGDGGSVAQKVADGPWQVAATGVQFKLRAVAGAEDVVYAVGELGTVLRRDASGLWTKEKSGAVGQLSRVVVWPDGAAAVTEEGALLVRTGGATGVWKLASETPGQLLYGVARRTDGLLVAVGYAGTLVTGQPAGPFTLHAKNVANWLSGVACPSAACVAVGQKGGIFQLAETLP